MRRRRRNIRPEVGVVQCDRDGILHLLDLVFEHLLRQGLRDEGLHLTQGNLADRDDLVNVSCSLVGVDRRNLVRLQFEYAFVGLRQRAWTTSADVYVRSGGGNAVMFHHLFLQLDWIFAGYPALPDLVSVSFLFGLGWLGLIRFRLTGSGGEDDSLQRHFHVFLDVLIVIGLDLLIAGMRELLGVMRIERLGQYLIHGETVDFLDLGVILQPKFAGRVSEGQQLGILGCETASHLGRHRFVRLLQRIGELFKLLPGKAA